MSQHFNLAGKDLCARRAPSARKGPWPLLLLLALLAVPAFPQTGSPDASGTPDYSSASSTLEDDVTQPYGGPSLAGRGFSPGIVPQIDLTPFVEISGTYGSGLNGIAIDPQGVTKTAAAAGVQYAIGLSGARAWRHTSLSLNYAASTTRYFTSAAYNNSTQSLSLGFTRVLSRHATLSVREAASIYSRSFTQPTVSSGYLPTLDIYGQRASMFSTQIALHVQKTARLSFSVAGSGGLTHKASSVVYDVGSAGVMADAQYRLSLQTTAGVSYSFSHFIYPGAFSSADYHSVTGNYAMALSRRLEFSLSAGFMRSESKFLQSVPLDPLLAYLIGVQSATVINHRVFSRPSGGGRLSRSFSRGSATISGNYSVMPGNGLFLATVGTGFSAGYSYTGLQRWNLSAGGSYYQGKSIGTSLGDYGNLSANVSASRQISRFAHAVIGFSVMQYQSSSVSYYNRLIHQARIGLSFSPGKIPLGPR